MTIIVKFNITTICTFIFQNKLIYNIKLIICGMIEAIHLIHSKIS